MGEGRQAFEQLLACLRGRPPREADWDAVLALANAHLVAPFLSLRLQGADASAPADVLDYLAMLSSLNESRNRQLRDQLLEAGRILNAAGVTPLVIKGARHLLDPGRPAFSGRMMTDLDLLIDAGEADRAIAALRDVGYAQSPRDGGAHAVACLSHPQDAAELDLHCRVPGPAGLLSTSAIRARASRFEERGAILAAPSLTDSCAIAIVHDMLHDRALRRGVLHLRRLLDLAVWTGAVDGCDWRDLHQRFRDQPAARWAVEVCARDLTTCLEIETGVTGGGAVVDMAPACDGAVSVLGGR